MQPPGDTDNEPCSIPCNLCGGTEVFVLARRGRGGQPLRTVVCLGCGLVWSDPMPHDPRSFYEHHYRLDYKGSYAPKPKHIWRAATVALSRLDKIRPLLARPLAVLDVGTGGGEFAYLLHKLGHKVSGVEPNTGYAEYAARAYQLNIQRGFVQDASFPPASFDLITIWHVLEHTEDPSAVLSRLNTLLKPAGKLVIEVPNVEATCQAPHSTFHDAHLFNFNTATLARMAEKAGFVADRPIISADGGNITLTAHKPEHWLPPPQLTLPGNAARIIGVVNGHTPLKHYLGWRPYARLGQRLLGSVREKIAVAGLADGKRLLDRRYRRLV